jgi:tRNA1(Val) A37 N6-methylase TrmN6
VIIEGGKLGNPELVVEEPFFIYKTGGGYSEAMQKIYDTV